MAGRPCTICIHPKREEIDRLIGEGVPYPQLGKRYDLQNSSLSRHKNLHIVGPKLAVVRNIMAKAETQPETALTALASLQKDTLGVLRGLKEPGADREELFTKIAVAKVELQAIREIRESIALRARITGELAPTQFRVQHSGEGQKVEEMSDQQLRAELEREAG